MGYRRTQERSSTTRSGLYLVLTLVLIASVIGGCVAAISLRRVDPGNAGVLIDYREGTQSGQPSITPKAPGRYVWISPITQRLAEYPVAQQTLTMVRSDQEGQVQGDDSVGCQDKDGVPINVDSSTLWRVNPDHVGDLYLLRPDMPLIGNEGNDISSTVVRREVRNAITIACSRYRYDEIYGGQRTTFGSAVTEILGPGLGEAFIKLDKFLLGEIHLLPEQQDAINRKVLAQQAALEAAFLKEKAENEAAANIAQAEGDKQVAILAAQAQAESIKIINEQLGQSSYYIEYVYAENWDGELPDTLVVPGDQELPFIGALDIGGQQQGNTPDN